MKALFLIAQKDFRDEELKEPRAILERGKIETFVAAPSEEVAQGRLGARVTPDMSFSEALRRVEEFDVFIVVGGPGCITLLNNSYALRLIQEARKLEKLIAAICWGPRVLAKAGILKEKTVTVCCEGPDSEVAKEMEAAGAKFKEAPVITDGRIITAFGPQNSVEFGNEILKKLKA